MKLPGIDIQPIRTMVGGDGYHESINLSDAELLSTVAREMGEIMKIEGEPVVTRLYRWHYGIPQYHIGHSELLETIESELQKAGNIYVAGNAYHGIGLNDCVKQSYRIAQTLS